MTATGGGTDGREPVGAPAGGKDAPAGGPTPGVLTLSRQLVREVAVQLRRHTLPVGLVAAGLVLGLVALLTLPGADGGEAATASPPAAPAAPEPSFPEPDLGTPQVPDVEPAEYPVAPPVSIAIPELGIEQNLIGLRVSPDGTMQVPQEWNDIGWWAKGPKPGESGGAVIAGHVNGGGQPAVFADLDSVPDGSEVVVERSDGSVATYQVTDRQQFPKDDFPDDTVYTFEGPTQLHLVTCGGEFDESDGHYKDNIVLFAELVSDTSPNAEA